MISATQFQPAKPALAQGLPLSSLQAILFWLMIASSWFVIVEPAPYEMLFPLCLAVFLPYGLACSRSLLPLIICLIIYNLGGAASVIPVAYDDDAVTFVIVSFYMATACIFFAMATAHDPLKIMGILRPAYVLAAVIGAILGMIGYFDIAGMGQAWAPISRAQGTFKDPNVLSTFLVPPALFLIQDILLRRARSLTITVGALTIILAGLFLAFSRGAWGCMVGATLLMFLLTFLITPSARLRMRIVLFMIAGALTATGMILFLLSFEAVRSIFIERASLVQSYDGGETGRFANQLRSLPMLLQLPNGFGPLQFGQKFGEDPHNVYINAFASYGWTGGFAYLLLILSTLAAAWRVVFTVSPVQMHAIAVFCPLLMTILQGMQIDTDHWRHFYLMLGLLWGLFAWVQSHARTPAASALAHRA